MGKAVDMSQGMEVNLIRYTPDPEKVVAAAARLCYSPRSANSIMEDFEEADIKDFLERLMAMGHDSPLEHVSFTFAIDGVSRALSHQLVRHRIGVSFSQKSQRYVTENAPGFVYPKSIKKDEETREIYFKFLAQTMDAYYKLIDLGVPKEDARLVLPNATLTNLVMTMNARSLNHFFTLRCCSRAQWEIRDLANLMLKEVKKVAPTLFKYSGANCESKNICYEDEKSCGKAPTFKKVMEEYNNQQKKNNQ